jgi:A/G-specific adenine glycosylase
MLQQTQASRVIPKYKAFLKKFPTLRLLALAPVRDVLFMWQGLGYNRRALALQRAARVIMEDHNGKFPNTFDMLLTLPGVGPYTASAIMTFSYNQPSIMIETNIRTVFIHFFFQKARKVSDKKLLPLIEKYMDTKNPREWYNALMDYGAMLKRTMPNPSRRSSHYVVQGKFHGSIRQVRGAIIALYTKNHIVTKRELVRMLPYDKDSIATEYLKLKNEGFFV